MIVLTYLFYNQLLLEIESSETEEKQSNYMTENNSKIMSEQQ